MSPERQDVIEQTLRGLPLNERLAALMWSVLVDDPVGSVENLIETATIMAKHLPAETRAGVAWELRAAADQLGATWN